MPSIYIVGTSDTKAAELCYLRDVLRSAGCQTVSIDVGTTSAGCEMDIPATEIAALHPEGPDAVLGGNDRGEAVSAMGEAFALFCRARKDQIAGIIGIGGGGGTSMVCTGLRELPYGVPKVMVSTLASGDVAPYVGISDIIMVPSVTDLAGLNRLSRHILHNAAHAVLGMAGHLYQPPTESKPSIGLTMFGVTTPCLTKVVQSLDDQFDCVVFHATGSGGRSMEQLLRDGILTGLIDITTTEIADELVGGVLSAGPERLDVLAKHPVPYVGSVGALDMVNFWAPETVPDKFPDRQFYHHNPNVTLMRVAEDESARIGRWIGNKLNRCDGPIRLLLPEKGISALDIEGGPFWNPASNAALFEALHATVQQNDRRRIMNVPHHINDPAFSAAVVETYLEII